MPSQSKQDRTTFSPAVKWGAGLVSAVVVLGIIFSIGGIANIPVGNVGIVKHPDGQVSEITQGINWVGWGVAVQAYPTYTQALILSNQTYEGGTQNQQWIIGTADQQELPVNTSLTWRINPADAADVYQAVGGQPISYIDDNIVEPTMKMVVNEVSHEYDYSSLRGPQLPQATDEINSKLAAQLAQDGIIVERFGFTYVGLPQGMQQAQGQLASAEIAQQEAQAQQKQAIIQNQTTILTAEAQAKANEIEAVGLRAKASALTQLLIQEDAIQRWNGKLPQYTGNAVPFIANSLPSTTPSK